MPTAVDVLKLLENRGDSQYGGEPVTQLEHALQCAALAEAEGASPELIIAALLHDVGHLLHDLPDDASDTGVDDHHERSGNQFLKGIFPQAVTEPVRLHVAAKRYLCTIDETYLRTLSRPSVVSFEIQGGKMTPDEMENFAGCAYAEDSVKLRRWDDAAKDPTASPPPLSHFESILRLVALDEPRP